MEARDNFHEQVKKTMTGFTDAQHLETLLLHDRWIPGRTYYMGDVVRHNGALFEVKQPVIIALESQPPDAAGMLAVYRPIVPEHTGTIDDPIPFVIGMDVSAGMHYSYDGNMYLADADMMPCTWAPDSGIWQWEMVSDTDADGDGDTEPADTTTDVIAFEIGMDVHSGLLYAYNGMTYIAKSDMIPCVWPPDTGIWQWELVQEGAIE